MEGGLSLVKLELEGTPAGSELEDLQQGYELHDVIIQQPVSHL